MSEKLFDEHFIKIDNESRYTQLIPLAGLLLGYSLCVLERKYSLGQSKLYSFLLIEGNKPVGHVDFSTEGSNEENSLTCMLNMLSNFDNLPLPEGILHAIEYFENDIDALSIDKDYRGRKLGSFLWAIACYFLRTQNISAITIVDTSHIIAGKSFYQRWGAKGEVAEKISSTELSEEQRSLLKQAFIE